MISNIASLLIACTSVVWALAPLAKLPLNSTAVDGHYIVALKSGVSADKHLKLHLNTFMVSSRSTHGSSSSSNHPSSPISHIYDGHAFTGYSGHFDSLTLQRIRGHPDVAYVEPDQVVSISSTQQNAPWNIARLSTRTRLPASGPYTYNYDEYAGLGVNCYVIDTGINIHHEDFGGRAVFGASFVGNEGEEDSNGHGTHCAGTIAGTTYGVAKKARLIAVKVIDKNGVTSWSQVIAGINWAAQQHREYERQGYVPGIDIGIGIGVGEKVPFKGSVISLSIGGGYSKATNEAVTNAVRAGCYVTIAGGNYAQDACSFSPASAQGGFTVGATDINDKFASFSNYGQCLDILAPGVQIASAGHKCNTCVAYMSGTSMAAPAVGGVMATFASQEQYRMTPEQMVQKLKSTATSGSFGSSRGTLNGSPNLLLFNNYNTN